jgi:hypothetical protein
MILVGSPHIKDDFSVTVVPSVNANQQGRLWQHIRLRASMHGSNRTYIQRATKWHTELGPGFAISTRWRQDSRRPALHAERTATLAYEDPRGEDWGGTSCSSIWLF